MKEDHRFASIDRAALHNALLALRTCPHCRADLQPVAYCADVYGCEACKETWHLPQRDAALDRWRNS